MTTETHFKGDSATDNPTNGLSWLGADKRSASVFDWGQSARWADTCNDEAQPPSHPPARRWGDEPPVGLPEDLPRAGWVCECSCAAPNHLYCTYGKALQFFSVLMIAFGVRKASRIFILRPPASRALFEVVR